MLNKDYLYSLIRELANMPGETEWIEFKENNESPDEIGEIVSALANSAALCGKSHGYAIWGVRNNDHETVGTTFSPEQKKLGNEELENWLLHLLSPQVHFQFSSCTMNDRKFVVLQVNCAFGSPVKFKNQEFIRIGTYTKKLRDHPERERELWRTFDSTPFERVVSVADQTFDQVLTLLDCDAYFRLLELPTPISRELIAEHLVGDRLIAKAPGERWNILNLGAILFARKLSRFDGLGRKAIRVVEYKKDSRIEALGEQEGAKGYAIGFEGLIDYINSRIPKNEIIGKALRRVSPMYPELAVRELVANAIIHQDFSITGSGPMVELFSDRMEITNPGDPLVKTDRFLDNPPQSRNEALAAFMRRIGVCEERGSGIDKVVSQIEFYQLPAPHFEVIEKSTRAILYAHRPVSKMSSEDRIRACYLHACLRYVSRDFMTNSSLRQRFGIEQKNKSMVSRYIREAMEVGAIKLYDPEASSKLRKYVPSWAQ